MKMTAPLIALGETTPAMDRRYHGTMRLGGGMGGNVVTPAAADGSPNELGYTLWHHDHPTPTDDRLPSHRTTKAFVALWDIPPDGGCTALVPLARGDLAAVLHCHGLCR
jgi:hypothetical protein